MTDTKTLNRVARRLHRDDIEIGNARDMARDMPWFELDNEDQDYYRKVAVAFINALEFVEHDLNDAAMVLTYLYLTENPNRAWDTAAIFCATYDSIAMVNDVLKGGK